MELTEHAVARPEEEVKSSDFESRAEWYRTTYGTEMPKRRGFLQVWFIRVSNSGGLKIDSELVPVDSILDHCNLIRTYWLGHGGYFKWAPDLQKQFEQTGVTLQVPLSLIEERSWRLKEERSWAFAENEETNDKYEHGNIQELSGIPESERQNARETNCRPSSGHGPQGQPNPAGPQE